MNLSSGESLPQVTVLASPALAHDHFTASIGSGRDLFIDLPAENSEVSASGGLSSGEKTQTRPTITISLAGVMTYSQSRSNPAQTAHIQPPDIKVDMLFPGKVERVSGVIKRHQHIPRLK